MLFRSEGKLAHIYRIGIDGSNLRKVMDVGYAPTLNAARLIRDDLGYIYGVNADLDPVFYNVDTEESNVIETDNHENLMPQPMPDVSGVVALAHDTGYITWFSRDGLTRIPISADTSYQIQSPQNCIATPDARNIIYSTVFGPVTNGYHYGRESLLAFPVK